MKTFLARFMALAVGTIVAAGVAGAQGAVPAPRGDVVLVRDQTYFEFQVEKKVRQLPDSMLPLYPNSLQAAKVEGEVVASFVVDTLGHVDVETIKILKATHQLFADAVRDALPQMKFIPAEIKGMKVKQLVQQPFEFKISP
jgi:protein TonB